MTSRKKLKAIKNGNWQSRKEKEKIEKSTLKKTSMGKDHKKTDNKNAVDESCEAQAKSSKSKKDLWFEKWTIEISSGGGQHSSENKKRKPHNQGQQKTL